MGTANVDIQHLHVAVNCPFMEALNANLTGEYIYLYIGQTVRRKTKRQRGLSGQSKRRYIAGILAK